MENPFESGHIKNYLLLYASIVLIMILFFIASSLFNEVEDVEKKLFSTEIKEEDKEEKLGEEVDDIGPKFKLLDKAY